jgi:hypothetical protein
LVISLRSFTATTFTIAVVRPIYLCSPTRACTQSMLSFVCTFRTFRTKRPIPRLPRYITAQAIQNFSWYEMFCINVRSTCVVERTIISEQAPDNSTDELTIINAYWLLIRVLLLIDFFLNRSIIIVNYYYNI